MKIVLSKPIKFPVKTGEGKGEAIVSEVELREELTMGDLEDVPASFSSKTLTKGDLMKVASNLSGQPLHVIRRMYPADWQRVESEVISFLAASLQDGQKP